MTIKHDPTIYQGIESWGLADDRQSFQGCDHPIFETLVKEIKPLSCVEVGSWKGVSACRWAQLAGPDCTVYCVDTWLGGADQQGNVDYKFPRNRGYPTVYFQFLANVKKNGYDSQIIPIPNTSHIGSLLLKRDGIWADICYIDASHDYYDVLRDLEDYWPLLRPGGALILDDYSAFSGVYAAVATFVETHALWRQFSLTEDRQFAVIRKE